MGKSVSFTITEPINSDLSVDELRKNLRPVSKETIKKIDSLLGTQGNEDERLLSGNEMRWLVEYERMIDSSENSLSEKELKMLSERWRLDFTLDDSSGDGPVIATILMPKDT